MRNTLLVVAFGVLSLNFTCKAIQAQSLDWMVQFDTPYPDEAYAVSVDTLGNVFLAGHTFGDLGATNIGHTDAFIRKLDTAGAVQWTRQWGSEDQGQDRALAVSSDNMGNAYVTGEWDLETAFLRKYDAEGNLQWEHLSPNARGNAVATDHAGNIYWAGRDGDSVNVNTTINALLTKSDNAGNFPWTRKLGAEGLTNTWSVSTDRIGNVYTAGTTRGDLFGTGQGEADSFIAKYDSDGNLLWGRQFGTASVDWIQGITADDRGDVYFAGYTNGSLGGTNAGNYDVFLGKYDADGHLLWLNQFGTPEQEGQLSGPGSPSFPNLGVCADDLGSIFITGITYGSLGESFRRSDAFIASFLSDGAFVWLEQFGTDGWDGASSCSADGLGHVYVAGSWNPEAAGLSAFVARFHTASVPEPTIHIAGLIVGIVSIRRRRRD